MQLKLPFKKNKACLIKCLKFRSSLKHLSLSRLLFIIAVSPVFSATSAWSMDISAGYGYLDEGDDRNRPAAVLHVGLTKDWQGRGYLWGRSYGPVSETSGIVAVSKRGGIFGGKALEASVGLSAMAEHTAITFKEYPAESTSYTSTNLGLMLGLNYNLFTAKSIDVNLTWDSHIFPAGAALIALVTGRKQLVGVTAGITF